MERFRTFWGVSIRAFPSWEADVRDQNDEALARFISASGLPVHTDIAEGQPYKLRLLTALCAISCDPDAGLPLTASSGFHTGCFDPIPFSGIFKPGHASENSGVDGFALLEGTWKSAEDSAAVEAVIRQAMEAGAVRRLPGVMAEVEECWGQGRFATGKHGLVRVEGKKGRVVLDSTVARVNPRCCIEEKAFEEKAFYPTIADVEATSPDGFDDPHQLAIVIDVASAHWTLKVREDEQGLLLFDCPGIGLCHLLVCHFGAVFSAY